MLRVITRSRKALRTPRGEHTWFSLRQKDVLKGAGLFPARGGDEPAGSGREGSVRCVGGAAGGVTHACFRPAVVHAVGKCPTAPQNGFVPVGARKGLWSPVGCSHTEQGPREPASAAPLQCGIPDLRGKYVSRVWAACACVEGLVCGRVWLQSLAGLRACMSGTSIMSVSIVPQ